MTLENLLFFTSCIFLTYRASRNLIRGVFAFAHSIDASDVSDGFASRGIFFMENTVNGLGSAILFLVAIFLANSFSGKFLSWSRQIVRFLQQNCDYSYTTHIYRNRVQLTGSRFILSVILRLYVLCVCDVYEFSAGIDI